MILRSFNKHQQLLTQSIAEHISSDLKLLRSILQEIADSTYLRQDHLNGDRIDKMMQEKFSEVNNVTKVDSLFIADESDIELSHIVTKGQRNFVNIDISIRDYRLYAKDKKNFTTCFF